MDDGAAPEDVLQQGRGDPGPPRLPGWLRRPGWRPSRPALLLAVAALAVGLAAGYLAGHQPGRGSAAAPAAAASSPAAPAVGPGATFSFADSPALTQGLGACSAQQGDELQLGVQLTSQSAQPLTLVSARAVLPLGGLRQVTQHWATCGALGGTVVPQYVVLQPGNSTWLTVTLRVSVRCPAAFPVQFVVRYQVAGTTRTAFLSGFNDLGQVPYSGCPAR